MRQLKHALAALLLAAFVVSAAAAQSITVWVDHAGGGGTTANTYPAPMDFFAGGTNSLSAEAPGGVAATITRIYCETITSTLQIDVQTADDIDGTNSAAAHTTITCDDDGETVTTLSGDATLSAGQVVRVAPGTEGGTFDQALVIVTLRF